MALYPKAQQGPRGGGGRGGVSSSAVARTTTPKRNKQGARGRTSPRLHFTQNRTQTKGRRGTGAGTRVASPRQAFISAYPILHSDHQKQSSRATGGASAKEARHTGGVSSYGGGDDGVGGRMATKKAVQQSDSSAKVLQGLKGELAAALETGMENLKSGCDEFVGAVLDRCSSAMSGREEQLETAEAALREMESRETSVTVTCSGMLKAIETNEISLLAMVERSKANLDNMQQAESLKLKSSLERAMGEKG
eukprot:g11036.t2